MQPSETTHNLTLKQRATIEISGIQAVESFDSEEFLLDTTMGLLHIKGENLQMKSFDVNSGIVSIEGSISAAIYTNSVKTTSGKGRFGKFFQ